MAMKVRIVKSMSAQIKYFKQTCSILVDVIAKLPCLNTALCNEAVTMEQGGAF